VGFVFVLEVNMYDNSYLLRIISYFTQDREDRLGMELKCCPEHDWDTLKAEGRERPAMIMYLDIRGRHVVYFDLLATKQFCLWTWANRVAISRLPIEIAQKLTVSNIPAHLMAMADEHRSLINEHFAKATAMLPARPVSINAGIGCKPRRVNILTPIEQPVTQDTPIDGETDNGKEVRTTQDVRRIAPRSDVFRVA